MSRPHDTFFITMSTLQYEDIDVDAVKEYVKKLSNRYIIVKHHGENKDHEHIHLLMETNEKHRSDVIRRVFKKYISGENDLRVALQIKVSKSFFGHLCYCFHELGLEVVKSKGINEQMLVRARSEGSKFEDVMTVKNVSQKLINIPTNTLPYVMIKILKRENLILNELQDYMIKHNYNLYPHLKNTSLQGDNSNWATSLHYLKNLQ